MPSGGLTYDRGCGVRRGLVGLLRGQDPPLAFDVRRVVRADI
jgi:hypothetical protein